MNVATSVFGVPQNRPPVVTLIVTSAPGPEFGSVSVEGLLPPVVIVPPGSTCPLAVVPFGALMCVVALAVPPPGDVVAESVMFVPPEPDDVRTSIFTVLEAPALMVPSEQMTGPVPVQPAERETNVVPAGKVSVTCTPETEDSLSVFVTFTVYCTLPPAVTGSGVSVIDVVSEVGEDHVLVAVLLARVVSVESKNAAMILSVPAPPVSL